MKAKIKPHTPAKRPSKAKFKKTSIGNGKNSRQSKPYKGQGR